MFGSEELIMVKRKADWTPTMEQRADLEGRQVKCLIASEGHLWMRNYFDRFPSGVRRRLAESAFNICPACMDKEAHTAARQRKEIKPSVGTYFRVIEAIERKLKR
jgi:hypothetical protein